MRNDACNIFGGAAVRYRLKHRETWSLPLLTFLIVFALSSSAFAQGSIFGSVTNFNGSTPANGEISFVGFLDNTDEEIRLDISTGAGYDLGNWFDDFQNYLTETPGNPYVYFFYNTANSQGFQLTGLIPNNSFQQEDVSLVPVSWPAAPSGLLGDALSTSSVVVSWNGISSLNYHVYRRHSSSAGSFFRLDNTAGDLSDRGVSGNFFVDTTVDGISSYDYVVIAEDSLGNYSPHSATLTVNSSFVVAPGVISINPNHGPAVGGTLVTFSGINFDPAGVIVQFGAAPAAPGTVVSPFEVMAVTPAGAVGPVDVRLTNLTSGLTSNVLTGGFTYDANTPPVLATIGPQSVTEGQLLAFSISATDVDGDLPLMGSGPLPGSATFVANPDGTGDFNWLTSYADAGTHNVTFYAYDALDSALVDSEIVTITVIEAGNQAPIMAAINDTSVAEGGSLVINVSATDPDTEIPNLSATGLPANATFVDNTDGTGLFTFNPDLTQSGLYSVVFKAVDLALAVDSQVVQITVTETNQPPVLTVPGPQSTDENVALAFIVTATDGDGITPGLSTGILPTGATFVDSLNGVGLFEWTPDYTQSGPHQVAFYATDGVDTDSGIVTITVVDAGNQPPVLAAIGPQTVLEGGNLNLIITALDPDGTFPTMAALGLPTNATFVDNGDGTAVFDFNPFFNQSGLYTITFIADDGEAADTEFVDITVSESGNQAPVFDTLPDTLVLEGDVLILTVSATDPDGEGIAPAISVNTTLDNYTLVDHHDGTATFTYSPDFFDAGVDTLFFFATDFGTPQQTGWMTVELTTVDVNIPPVWVAEGPYGVSVGDTLQFTVTATDSTDPNPVHILYLSTIDMPLNASFTDNGDGTGEFTFTPDASQAGVDTVTFLAVDQGSPQLSTTLDVQITVVTENIPPVLDTIGPQTNLEGQTLIVNISATDPDGPPPQLSTSKLPDNSTFVDNGDGTGVFTFFPNYVQAGLHFVTFKAYDGFATVKEVVIIQVYEAGDQNPVFDPTPPPVVVEGDTLYFTVTAHDPDEISISLVVTDVTLPSFATFLDSANGVGLFTVTPDFRDSGSYDIEVIASDGNLTDTANITLTVQDAGNQLPVIAVIPDQTTKELIPLAFDIYVMDVDGSDLPYITGDQLPAGATVTDNHDGTGQFNWTPSDVQAGTWDITILAEDFDFPGVYDSEFVTITVLDTNRVPFIVTSGSRTIFEGDTLEYAVYSTDPDGTIPILGARIDGDTALTVPNMIFFDSANGTGVLTFTPDFSQGNGGSQYYYVRFYAIDAADASIIVDATAPVQLEVRDRNAPPELILLDGPGPYSVAEGDTLSFQVAADDVDGTSPPVINVTGAPANASFSGVPGFGTFRFYPDYTQSGTYFVTFTAVDELSATASATVQIDVSEAGNQAPLFTSNLSDTINVPTSAISQVVVRSEDPDLDPITLSALPIWGVLYATFVDSGNGVGVYNIAPEIEQLDSVYQVEFVASDPAGLADTLVTHLRVVSFLRGDLDNTNTYTMNDLAWLIAYLFRDGPAPEIPETADVNKDNDINIADITYLIRFLYYSGPQPPQ